MSNLSAYILTLHTVNVVVICLMIERDYIVRVIQEFFKLINGLLGKLNEDNADEIHRQLQEVYSAYFGGSCQFFYQLSCEDLLGFIDSDEQFRHVERVEMLSELLYRDGLLTGDTILRNDLLGKALALIERVEKQSKSFSVERNDRKTGILAMLN